MSAASAIGLFICPMENESEIVDKATNVENQLTMDDASAVPTPAYQRSSSTSSNLSRSIEKEFRFNVYLQATIHHNITINSEKPFNIINNYNSSSMETIKNFQDIIPNNVRKNLYESLVNDSFDPSSSVVVADESPKIDELKLEPKLIFNQMGYSNSMSKNPNAIPKIFITGNVTNIDPCFQPKYMVFTWILCLIALATGLKLYYLVKTFMAIIMVICYSTLILGVFPDVFTQPTFTLEPNCLEMPATAQIIILLMVFLTMVTYHARLVEVTSRLDFIWKEQAEKELTNMKSNRYLNDLLIKVSRS